MASVLKKSSPREGKVFRRTPKSSPRLGKVSSVSEADEVEDYSKTKFFCLYINFIKITILKVKGKDMFAEYFEIIFGFLKAFVVGGLICAIAQVVINFTDLTAGKILVIFMLSGVALQGLGLYQYLVDFAGAGATVPISGFGYLLASGAIKGAEKGLFGAFTGALASASAGISAAVIFSFLMAMFFRSRTKKN